MTYHPDTRIRARAVYYPETDGKPIADNTLQFDYIVEIKLNLEVLYEQEKVFIAGDLFWYPEKGQPKIVVAPDVLVAYDRPKGYRGSYKQWEEEGIAPKVVFEVLSHSNTAVEMIRKANFYDKYGVEEFIIVDPYENNFTAYVRQESQLKEIEVVGTSWKSSIMGVTIEKAEDAVKFYHPDGEPFRNPEEWKKQLEEEKLAKEQERLAKEQERLAKEEALREVEKERQEKEQLLAELAALKAQLGK